MRLFWAIWETVDVDFLGNGDLGCWDSSGVGRVEVGCLRRLVSDCEVDGVFDVQSGLRERGTWESKVVHSGSSTFGRFH